MHYVRSLYIKMHIGVIRPRIRVRNEISRFLSSAGPTSRSALGLSNLTPDSSSCPISDRKDPLGKFMNSSPPLWDLSRESWALDLSL
jgi:hypothetical protein